ncbi:MAG: 2-hydroxyacyl-CoA dehydratase family protein [Actinomycetota bacterium]|nr:2-hydroxyacyl-CoA dehydratase family protein [Actinomycetota bacterium]
MTQDIRDTDNFDKTRKKINDIKFFFGNTLTSENKKAAIGWFCTYTPEELIIAGGFVPVRIFGRKKIIKSESYFPINFCPYIKSGWESLLADADNLKAIIFTNSCDGMRRFFDIASKYLDGIPSYLLDVPHLKNRDSRDFFTGNMDDMKKFIEKLKGEKINEEEIENAVKLINKKRKLLKEFSNIFYKSPDLIEIPAYYKVMELSMISDPEIFLDDLEKYLGFIGSIDKTSTKNGISLQPDQRNSPSIMIIGNFIAEDKLWEMLSKMNLKLASEDLCTSNRYFVKQVVTGDNKDLMESIAERYLNKPQCMRMADPGSKLAEIENVIIKNHIKGVIFITLKFCDNMLYSFPLLKQRLNNMGIPVLYLDIEYNNFSEGQIKTRVQAFLEML